MAGQLSHSNKWVVVGIRTHEFAIPVDCVREIVAMPDVTAVPLLREQDRGVINLRGRVIPLVDTRKQFGWPSVPEELDAFYKLMSQREQDHRKWLGELERSIKAGSEFRLATDPHKCAFGQWYYSYRSDSPWIASLLRKFEAPHNRIHALAAEVDELVRKGAREEAHRHIEEARNGVLTEMVALFQQLRDLMRESVKELALVTAVAENPRAFSIDSAIAVEVISSDQIKNLESDAVSPGGGVVRRVVQRTTGALAMVLERELFDTGARLGSKPPTKATGV